MTRILIVTGDPVGDRMAGPAIRAWNIALELQRHAHEVRIVSTTQADRPDTAVDKHHVTPGDEAAMRVHERWAEVVFLQGHALGQFRCLRATDRYLVADVYDPMHLEMLEQGRELPTATWSLRVAAARDALNDQLRRADYLLCASDRQRLFYLGHLASLGRISPTTYEGDGDLRRLIDLAPFGLSTIPPAPGDGLRGRIAGIGDDDRVLIWGGGVYSWFDPLTLIRAVAAVRVRVPVVRLVFLGTKHPGVDEMGIVREAYDLAVDLGVEGREVVFNDTWVPYDERGAYLLDADAGVSTHHSHVETTFAFRTRILDYLWAGLPMVVTDGDGFADLVREENLGIVVPPNNEQALADALARVLAVDSDEVTLWRANVARVREQYSWRVVLEPLVAYCAAPWHAADFVPGRAGMGAGVGRAGRTAGFGHDLRMAAHHLKHSGVRDVIARIRRRIKGST